jgi:methyltransferase (TIGR00027 family)
MSEPVSSTIGNVSDTAIWVAMYRALESERPDAVFNDPYARKLAGPRGPAILEGLPKARRDFSWPMVVRTAVLDDVILKAVQQDGVGAILNLAAGLDARPYRLPFPRTLKWFDVDLPDIGAYKQKALAGETPRCELEYVQLDVTDRTRRRTLFARVGAAASKVLVVSEGLLVYLTPEQVGDLATDLSAQPTFRWWAMDIASPKILERLKKMWDNHLEAAPLHFAPAESTRFFESFGWKEREFRSTFKESLRINRTFRGARIANLIMKLSPKKKQEETLRMGGVAVLENARG